MARSFTLDCGTEVYGFGRDGLYVPATEYFGRRFRIKCSGLAVAWRVAGRIVESVEVYDEGDGECIGHDVEPTGGLACIMVGDDRVHVYDESDLAEIADEDYCGTCGQIGCGWH